jgi:hypothetical protein
MKRLTLLLCLALCLPLTAHADDATKRAKVQEMLNLLHIDRTMDQLMDLFEKEAAAATNAKLNSQGASADRKTRMDAFQKQLFDFIESQIGWKSMQAEYIDLYANTFTEDEIDGMLAFYKSPAGVAMINKTPELMTKSSTMVQKKMLAIEPQIQKMVQDFASNPGKHSSPALNSN